MGTWGTGIKDNDAFADVYSEFFDEYNKGGEPGKISKNIIEKNWEVLEIEKERNSLWFAIGLAQWETKSKLENVATWLEEDLSIFEESKKAFGDLKTEQW